MWRMACLGDQNSLASIIRLGREPFDPGQCIPHHRQALQVALQITTDLELARPDAVGLGHPLVIGTQLIVRQRHVQAARVGGDSTGARAQLTPQRHAIGFGAQVPQGAVQGRDRVSHGTVRPCLEGDPLHQLVHGTDRPRIAADQLRRQRMHGW